MHKFKNFNEAYERSRSYNRKGKVADFPPYVTFELISSCNFRCVMCPATYLKKSRNELNFGLFKKNIDEISAYGSLVRFIGYCEPLLYSRIEDAINYVKEKKLLLQITTNGSLLDERMVKVMVDGGVDVVIFSFQGFTEKEYCLMRNISSSAYSKLIDNIRLLYKIRKSDKPYIRITTTVTNRDNPKDKDKFIKTHSDYTDEVQITGATHFIFLKEFFKVEKLSEKLKLDRPKKIKDMKCFLANYEMKIIENGDAYICCGALYDDLLLGNIKKSNLFDLWHSTRAANLREVLSAGDLTRFKDCSVCPIRYLYKNMGNTVLDTIKGKTENYSKNKII